MLLDGLLAGVILHCAQRTEGILLFAEGHPICLLEKRISDSECV